MLDDSIWWISTIIVANISNEMLIWWKTSWITMYPIQASSGSVRKSIKHGTQCGKWNQSPWMMYDSWLHASWIHTLLFFFLLADCECWMKCDGKHNECFVNNKRIYFIFVSSGEFVFVSISITIFNFNWFVFCSFINRERDFDIFRIKLITSKSVDSHCGNRIP